MNLAIVGANCLVGQEMLMVLEEQGTTFDHLYLAASQKSAGRKVAFRGKEYVVQTIEEVCKLAPDIVLFSAGGSVSLEWAPKFAEAGATVIDNSSAWRMDPSKKLIVPEINGEVLTEKDRIIANPNCSTIQMVMALAPLHRRYGLKRVVVSTYQSVTGTGKAAIKQMEEERSGNEKVTAVYPHQIDQNALPHIDVFLENGYTKEEMKMVNETRKILGDESIGITSTTVRIPTVGGHAESINVAFHEEFEMNEVFTLLEEMPGVVVQDDIANDVYPMPILSQGKDEVFVGRLRRDESQPKTLNMWVVADNLRKGAATNAVHIAMLVMNKVLVKT